MEKGNREWEPIKTLQVVSQINYWDNFQKTHPDKSPIKSIIASDPIIRKICTFCYPAILALSDLRQYPFDEKISEIDSITEEEIAHFEDKLNLSSGLDRVWLRFARDVFHVTKNTVKVKDVLSKSGKLSEEQVLQGVSSAYSVISMKDIITLSDIHGKEEFLIRTGKFWPCFILEYHSRQNKGAYEYCINVHHLFKRPSKKEIETKFDWDSHSGETFVRYLRDDIDQLFKDITQYQSDSAKKTIVEMVLHGKNNYTIQHFFGGKPIFDQPFVYQIGKRYEPLLKATTRNVGNTERRAFQKAFDNSEEMVGVDVSSMGSIWESFVRTLLTFDPSKGRLASHLKLGIEPRTKDEFKKRQRISKREHSGGSLDEFINFDDEGAGRRVDFLTKEDLFLSSKRVTPANTNPEEGMIGCEEDTTLLEDAILNEVHKDKELMRILESGSPMSVTDRKIKERKFKAIRKKFGIRS